MLKLKILTFNLENLELISIKSTLKDFSMLEISDFSDHSTKIESVTFPYFDILIFDLDKLQSETLEFLAKLKETILKCELTLIFLKSQDTNSSKLISALNNCADLFLNKPINHIELSAIFNSIHKIKKIIVSDKLEMENLNEKINTHIDELEKELSQKKLAEIALKGAETRYRLLFEQSPNGVLLIDLENGKTIEANQKAADQLGYTLEEFETLQISDYEALENPEETKKHLERIFQNGGDQFETLHKTKKGEIRNIFVLTKLFFLNDKGYFLSIFQDITERKKTETEILHEKNFNESAINSLPGLFYLFDDKGQFLRWNKNFELISGYTYEEISKMSPLDFFSGDEKKLIESRIYEVFDKGNSDAEAHFVSKNQNKTLHYFTGKRFIFDGKPCLAGMGIDISKLKETEDELRYRNTELLALNNLSKITTISFSLAEQIPIIIKYLSTPLQADLTLLFLRDKEDLKLVGVGPANSNYIHKNTPVHRVGECLCGLAAKTGLPIYSMNIFDDFRCTWKECKEAGLHSFASIPLVYDKQIIGVIGIGSITKRDFRNSSSFLETAAEEIALAIRNSRLYEEITELNSVLEEKVQERTSQLESANKEIEAFSYSVSHDLRAPLRAIEGWSEALSEDFRELLDEKGQKYLERIRSETSRMGILIEDLLRLSKLTRSEINLNDVNLSKIAFDISNRLKDDHSRKNVNFNFEENIHVRGDSRLLEVALTNLLNNSFKFTGNVPNAVIEFGQIKGESETVYFVKDNGAGFNLKYAEKLFAPFQRMHKASEFPGTGIGLSIVQRIIHRHGGKIWAETEPHKGATFYFTLANN